MAQTLHQSVKTKHWQLAQQALTHYLTRVNSDPMLIHYAKGSLARNNGNYLVAEQEFFKLLEKQKNFLPAQLELARVYFENQKNVEAHTLFNKIQAEIPEENPRAQGVRNTVFRYIEALESRDQWHGSFAFGSSWDDNINRSSESYTCLLRVVNDPQCLIDRSTPKAKSVNGFDYDTNINKRISISGHHGLQFEALSYGSFYQKNSQYNQGTSALSTGYSFQNSLTRLSVLPRFEFSRYDQHLLYVQPGLKVEWIQQLSTSSAFKMNVKADYQKYRPWVLDYQSDWQWNAGIDYWKQLSSNWTFFTGVDWLQKDNSQKEHAFQLVGLRLGINKNWNDDFELTAFTSNRQRQYQGFNALLGGKRKDYEQTYVLVISAKKFEVFGLTPVLSWQFNKTNSSIDWLYSYNQNKVSLKLEKRF